MTIQKAATTFGVVFIVIGVLGFVPGITRDHMLLGLFHVNAAHNLLHILSGLIALWCASVSAHASIVYCRSFGAIYALFALLGFVVQEGMLFGIVSNNMADTWLHVLIAGAALYLGFGYATDYDKGTPRASHL